MRIYGLKACDTCRKAKKALSDAELVDIREHPMSADFLTRALEVFGHKLVNTRSTTWRGLTEAEREQDPMALLTAHPALMKRPLVEKDGQLYLGWTKDVQDALGAG